MVKGKAKIQQAKAVLFKMLFEGRKKEGQQVKVTSPSWKCYMKHTRFSTDFSEFQICLGCHQLVLFAFLSVVVKKLNQQQDHFATLYNILKVWLCMKWPAWTHMYSTCLKCCAIVFTHSLHPAMLPLLFVDDFSYFQHFPCQLQIANFFLFLKRRGHTSKQKYSHSFKKRKQRTGTYLSILLSILIIIVICWARG